MKGLLIALILVLSVTVLGSAPEQGAHAKLKTFTKRSAVAQAEQDGIVAENFLITDPARPFRFQKVSNIRKITKLTITLTLSGGTTGPGESNVDELTLALDGIDTGLLLNGFPNDPTVKVTQTISGVPRNESAIRAALKKDGKLAASIIDADPDDNEISGSSADTTTLVIKGKQKKGK